MMKIGLRFLESVKYLLIILPLIWSILLLTYYFMCALELGCLPVPSVDDPKSFGFEILAYVLWIGLGVLFYSAPVVAIVLVFLRKKLHVSTIQIGIYATGIFVVLYLLVLDPWRIFSWFLD